MQTQLAELKKAIAAEKIETPHLKVACNLFDQLVVRLFHHQTDAAKIAEAQAAAKAAEVEAAAKIVQQDAQEKADAAAKLAQVEQKIEQAPTATTPTE